MLSATVGCTLIAPSASGLRHLRFAREVLGSLRALDEVAWLPAPSRDVLRCGSARLALRVQQLSEAVKPYRDWLERERVHYRGNRRIALHLAREVLLAVPPDEVLPLQSPDPESFEGGDKAALQWALRAMESLPASEMRASEDMRDRALQALRVATAELQDFEAPRQRQLHADVDSAIDALRLEMQQLDALWRKELPARLVDALYPPLAEGGSHILDESNAHDDAIRSHDSGGSVLR